MEKLSNDKQKQEKKLIVEIDTLYEKQYKLRKTGEEGFSVSVTIPKLILEYEAKQRGLTIEDLLKEVNAVWKFNHLRGHYLFTFTEKKNPLKNDVAEREG